MKASKPKDEPPRDDAHLVHQHIFKLLFIDSKKKLILFIYEYSALCALLCCLLYNAYKIMFVYVNKL